MNNHFNDFEGDPAMTRFLEEFENNLEREVRVSIFSDNLGWQGVARLLLCITHYAFSLLENGWTFEAVKYCLCC